MTLSRRTVLQVSTAALMGLGASGASDQAPVAAAPPAPRQTQSDDYTRYELLDPLSASFRIVYEVTATTPGAKHFWNPRNDEVRALIHARKRP